MSGSSSDNGGGCFNSRCYGNFVGPARDQAYNTSNVDRQFATCLKTYMGSAANCGIVPIIPEVLGLYMAPSTATPPGDDANSGQSFASPVLTFTRIYEIIRAIGFEDTALVHMASGVYPVGAGSGSAIDGACVNADTGVVGAQCGSVHFQGFEPTVVHAAVTVSAAGRVQAEVADGSAIAPTVDSPSTLAQATLNVAAATLKIGDLVTFASGERAQISGFLDSAVLGVTTIVFPVSHTTMPGVVTNGAALITRIVAATGGSVVQVTNDFVWRGANPSVATWFSDVRFELQQSAASTTLSNLVFLQLPTALNNVLFVDVDTALPGNKRVTWQQCSATSGPGVFAPATPTSVLPAPLGTQIDYAGVTLDGSDAGAVGATGGIIVSSFQGVVALQTSNAVQAEFGGGSIAAGSGTPGGASFNLLACTSFRCPEWRVYDRSTLVAQLLEQAQTIGATFGNSISSISCVGRSLLNIEDANFDASLTTFLQAAVFADDVSSLVLNKVNVVGGFSGVDDTGYAGGVLLQNGSTASSGTLTVDSVRQYGVQLLKNSMLSVGKSGNAEIGVIVTHSEQQGIIVMDGSQLSSDRGLQSSFNTLDGVLVDSASTLSVESISNSSLRVNSNGSAGVRVQNGSRATVTLPDSDATPSINTNGDANLVVEQQSQMAIVIGDVAGTGLQVFNMSLGGINGVRVTEQSSLAIDFAFTGVNTLNINAAVAGDNVLIANESSMSIAFSSAASRVNIRASAGGNGIVVDGQSSFVAQPHPGVVLAGIVDIRNNASNGVLLSNGSRLYSTALRTVGAPTVGIIGMVLQSNSSAVVDFAATMNGATRLRGAADEVQVGSSVSNAWATVGTYAFTAANQNVNDYNVGLAIAAVRQACSVTSVL